MKKLFFTLFLFNSIILFAQIESLKIETTTSQTRDVTLYKSALLEEEMMQLNESTEISIIDYYAPGIWKVRVKNTDNTGYLIMSDIVKFKGYWDIISKYSNKTYLDSPEYIARQDSTRQNEFEIRRRKLPEWINSFGEINAEKILNQKYWIGMTEDMARESLGKPDVINRIVTKDFNQNQWVYNKRNLFLYFQKGVLIGFQD